MPSTARRYPLLAVVGLIGGLLSGAFGVGGGFIMVPLLILLVGFDQRRAAATSLVAIIPTAIAGTTSYALQGQTELLAGLIIAAGGIVGSLIGTRLLRDLPIGWLRWGFIALLLAVAVRAAIAAPERGAGIELGGWEIAGFVLLGVVMGIASGLFGVGGGIVAVPVMVGLFGISDLLAKGTSLLAVVPTSVTGTVANLRNGLVRLVDGVLVGVCATGASFVGVWIAFWIEPRVGGILFALLVLFTALQLAWRAIRDRRTKA